MKIKLVFPFLLLWLAYFLVAVLVVSILALLVSEARAGRLNNEDYYQALWCKGELEVVLPDSTRVDCLTDDYAVEVDFADKWYNGTGQALHYALMTNRLPGLLLIVESLNDLKYVERAQQVAMRHGIRIWLVWP